MIVKVCGLRQAENIREVEKAGADWFGFIFYPKSPRFVGDMPSYLPASGRRIGVFVSPSFEDVVQAAERFGLHGVQLHGEASPELCQRLHDVGFMVVRALPAAHDLNVTVKPYRDAVDYFLFDTPTKNYGGSGRVFDWSLLRSYDGDEPFLLSGGLRPDSMETVSHFGHPKWVGVDLNSGFETAPGVKSAADLENFITALRKRFPS